MAEKYGVFLRGVNTGGVKIKMDALKKVFADMSFTDAKTILATGNVVVSFNSGRAALKLTVEAGMKSALNYDAGILIRSLAELESVLTASKSAGAPEGCHLYYLLCDGAEVIRELAEAFAALPHQEHETFIPLDTGAFWIVPVGQTLESAFGSKALGDKKYKNLLTSRNINTIEKIYTAMRV